MCRANSRNTFSYMAICFQYLFVKTYDFDVNNERVEIKCL